MDELIRRAIAAHYRSGGRDQPGSESEVTDIGDRRYVVLRNINGVMAVYRLTTQGKLRIMRRWPAEIRAEA